ncbi:uncharacterized protein M6G45_015389 [Spheniscus humboldti]
MQAEAVKQELCTLQERLAQCSAESQRHKELLRSLEEMHEDLRGAIEKLNSEGDEHYAQEKARLREVMQENEVVPKGLGENAWVPTGPGVGRLEEGCSGLRDLDPSFSQVLRQEIKKLEEALEQEETCQQQRKKEAEHSW